MNDSLRAAPEHAPEPLSEPLSESSPAYAPPAAQEAAVSRIRAALARQDLPSLGRLGAWTLLKRELRRFWSMAGQTLLSPIITTLLYFLVFGYSLGDRLREVGGVPYMDFLVPGLVMLATINNAYINASFSLFLAKIHGAIVDLLVTPLSYLQLMLAYTGASMVRALLVAGVIWIVAALMGASTVTSASGFALALATLGLTALLFSLLGLLVAILSETFDHVNFLPSFLITPLTFLGGVFYSISVLPEPWRAVSRLNPVLYMISALRYGMTGVSDAAPWQGLALLALLSFGVGAAVMALLRSGYKLRQ